MNSAAGRSSNSGDSIGDYLIKSLYGRGVRHVFGVPGDYVLGFYDRLAKSNRLAVVNTCDEQGAGFAADAYARIRGLGAVCVTYGVGAFKVVNTTSQAFAEKSPVVVISGAPGVRERMRNPLLHHKVKNFDTQKKVFDQVTAASAVLDDPQVAAQEINRVLAAALRLKRPVYIELPRDMVGSRITGSRHDHYYDGDGDDDYYHSRNDRNDSNNSGGGGSSGGSSNSMIPAADDTAMSRSDPVVLREAVAEATEMIASAKKPVIIAGEEIHRFGLQDRLVQFIEKTGIPFAATILGKSVIDELHPLYIGIYEGAVGQEDTRRYVESSDCVIMLGAFMTDITLGMFTAQLDQSRTIYATSERISIRYHAYDNLAIQDFLQALAASPKAGKRRRKNKSKSNNSVGGAFLPEKARSLKAPAPRKGKKITIRYLFARLNSFLADDTVVLADVGDALFAGADLVMHGKSKFLSPAYYASLGFAVPGSIGVQLADPGLRPLVLVGDGAFQMTGMELATAARLGLNPIVVVLNNGGYMTERLMLDGPFNDLQPWEYSRIPEVVCGSGKGKEGKGFVVRTEDQFDSALAEARDFREGFSILDVQLGPGDRSPALQRLTKRVAGQVGHGH